LGTLTDLATLYYLVGFEKQYYTSAIQGRASSLSEIWAWRNILKSRGDMPMWWAKSASPILEPNKTSFASYSLKQ
jgi:hypothetical protein